MLSNLLVLLNFKNVLVATSILVLFTKVCSTQLQGVSQVN